MSYFSRISIKSGALAAQEGGLDAGDAYRDHTLIWRLFPDSPDKAPRDFLFRAASAASGTLLYYLVSQRQPQSWHPLVTVNSKPFQPRLETGEWVDFSLRANPTVAIASAPDQRGKRHDVLMHAKTLARQAGLQGESLQQAIRQAALAWLDKRAASWGLQIDPDQIQADGYCQHVLRSKGRELRFSSVDYQGMARVQDPERLTQAMLGPPLPGKNASLGHAQAFGCGLLLVKRLA